MDRRLDEDAVIEAASRLLSGIGAPTERGIGDDAAVVAPPAGRILLTTDMLVEGVHFDRAWTGAADLGWKSVAVNVSDIAAMGGEPLYALLSLGLPAGLTLDWVADFLGGLKAAAARYGVGLAGGDTVASPGGLVVNIALLGEAREPLTRDRSRPGDLLFVTGPLGAGAAGLWACRTGQAALHPEAVGRLLRPQAEIDAGRLLRPWAGRISLLDDSDGLARSVAILAGANHAGAVIDARSLPVHPAAASAAGQAGADPLDWALYGGDDYVLVGALRAADRQAVANAFRHADLAFYLVGELDAGPGVRLRQIDGSQAPVDARAGFRHFG